MRTTSRRPPCRAHPPAGADPGPARRRRSSSPSASSEGGFGVTAGRRPGCSSSVLLRSRRTCTGDRLGELEPANRIAMLFLAGVRGLELRVDRLGRCPGNGLGRLEPGARLPDRLRALLGRLLAGGLRRASSSGSIRSASRSSARSCSSTRRARREAVLSLISGRLAEPTGYPNAVAALFVGGFWPAIYLASRRETPWPAAGVDAGDGRIPRSRSR